MTSNETEKRPFAYNHEVDKGCPAMLIDGAIIIARDFNYRWDTQTEIEEPDVNDPIISLKIGGRSIYLTSKNLDELILMLEYMKQTPKPYREMNYD